MATAKIYAQAYRSAFHKEMNVESDSLKLMLTTSAYAYNANTDRYQSSVTNEVTGTGYVAGGIALTGVTVTDAAGVYTLDANNANFGTLTVTGIRTAVLYDATPGSAATNPLIWLCDFGADSSPGGVNFTIAFNASGILAISN